MAARRKLKQLGLLACVRDAASAIVERNQQELAFQCCAKVMGADRAFPVEEESMLRKLQDLLGFDERAHRIGYEAEVRKRHAGRPA